MNAPWPPDKLLRLSILEAEQFQIHIWSDRRGITLRYYDQPYQTWAAYATTRSAGKPQPETYALWATDSGRYRQTGAGTFDLSYQDGKLVMTRGDLILLIVPLPGPPQEVYLEGAGKVRGLELIRSQPVPLPTPFVVKNGSKTRWRSSSAIPVPVSSTSANR